MNVEATSNAAELRELYRQLILDHARKPRHFGALEHATHSADGINPLCGDKLHLDLHLDSNHVIQDVAFDGTGCAISVASASLMTDTVAGLKASAALLWFERLTTFLTGTAGNDDLGKLVALQGVREFPSRVKCATLAWHTLHTALDRSPRPATSE